MHRAPRSRRIPGLLLLLIPLLAGPVMAEEMAEEDVVAFERLTASQQVVISEAGTVAVGLIRDARAHMRAQQRSRVRRDLGRARTLLQLVRDTSPPARVESGIDSVLARLRGEKKAGPDDLLPIYRELDSYGRVVTATDTVALVDSAKGKLAAGEFEAAEADLVEAQKTLVYTEIDLPVRETLIRLGRAIEQVERKDLAAADAILEEAESHIQTFVEVASIRLEEEDVAVGAGPME